MYLIEFIHMRMYVPATQGIKTDKNTTPTVSFKFYIENLLVSIPENDILL